MIDTTPTPLEGAENTPPEAVTDAYRKARTADPEDVHLDRLGDDRETSRLAIRALLTGHRVTGSVRTDAGPRRVRLRLDDYGPEPDGERTLWERIVMRGELNDMGWTELSGIAGALAKAQQRQRERADATRA